MKKILTALLLVVSISAFTQKNPKYSYNVDFDMSNITGTDTVLFTDGTKELLAFGTSVTVEIDYTGLNADDATFSVGGSNFGYTFNNLDATLFPYTMNVADSAEVNGVSAKAEKQESKFISATSRYTTKSWVITNHPFDYIPLKIVKGSVTSGTLRVRIRENLY